MLWHVASLYIKRNHEGARLKIQPQGFYTHLQADSGRGKLTKLVTQWQAYTYSLYPLSRPSRAQWTQSDNQSVSKSSHEQLPVIHMEKTNPLPQSAVAASASDGNEGKKIEQLVEDSRTLRQTH